MRIDCPADKFGIIVVGDSSTDRTRAICESFANTLPGEARFYHRSKSNGKPSQLNFAIQRFRGEILGIFDADIVPDPTAVSRSVALFREPSIVAIQGLTRSLNPRLNLLTRLVSYEEQVW